MTGSAAKNTGIASRWEWVAAGVSAVLVLGMLVVLAAGAVDDQHPPRISATVDSVIALNHGYLVRVTVSNDGSATAADLVIEGELSGAEGGIETSTVTLEYVPGSGERQAGLYFEQDPRSGVLRVRPLGYRAP